LRATSRLGKREKKEKEGGLKEKEGKGREKTPLPPNEFLVITVYGLGRYCILVAYELQIFW